MKSLAAMWVRWGGGLVALVFALTGVLAVCGTLLLFVVVKDLPQVPEPLRRIIETPPLRIFAANGEQVLQIGGREYVPLNQVSRHFIQAFWPRKIISSGIIGASTSSEH